MPQSDEEPLIYALRIGERAERDIIEAVARFLDLEGEQIAVAWETGLYRHLSTLSVHPQRYPSIPEQARFTVEVRSTTYRRTNGSVAYRLLYTVTETSPDGPFVLLLTVRHGAAKAITRTDARTMEAQTHLLSSVPRRTRKSRKKRSDP